MADKAKSPKPYRLIAPFDYQGEHIEEVTITRRPLVIDRINAARLAEGALRSAEGDAVLLCVLAEVAAWGKDGKKIPGEVLAGKLDFEDFTKLIPLMGSRDFLPGPKTSSKPPSGS